MTNVYMQNSKSSTTLKSNTKTEERGLPATTKLCHVETLMVSHPATVKKKERGTEPELYQHNNSLCTELNYSPETISS